MKIMIRDRTEHFYIETNNNDIYFYSIKDKKEIAWKYKEDKTLYINSDYKKSYSKVLKEIKNKYSIAEVVEYCNLCW